MSYQYKYQLFHLHEYNMTIPQVAEIASAMLDSKLVSMFSKFPDIIDTIHFSDQYSGPKPTEVRHNKEYASVPFWCLK